MTIFVLRILRTVKYNHIKKSLGNPINNISAINLENGLATLSVS